LLAGALLLLASGKPVGAAEQGKTGRVDAQAMKIIERMSDFLGRAQKFSVTIDMAYDIVQEWGQKIEFGETRVVTVRRPDRIRVDVKDRDGSSSGLVFDGKDIAVFDLAEKVYATVAKPGSLDGAIAYFVDDLGMELPMGRVLSPDLPKVVAGWAHTVSSVAPATIAGVPCDHLSLRGDWEDVQMWVAQGDEPLLQRLVITYKRAEGQPQFSAQLRDWNLSAEAPDSLFAFSAPEGAAKIAFAPLMREQQPGAPAAQGGRP
jgi:hypothetical protein